MLLLSRRISPWSLNSWWTPSMACKKYNFLLKKFPNNSHSISMLLIVKDWIKNISMLLWNFSNLNPLSPLKLPRIALSLKNSIELSLKSLSTQLRELTLLAALNSIHHPKLRSSLPESVLLSLIFIYSSAILLGSLPFISSSLL